MKYQFEFLGLLLLKGLMAIIPVQMASYLGGVFGRCVRVFLKKRSNISKKNLDLAGFSLTLIPKIWTTWGESFFEIPHLSKLLTDPKRLVIEGDISLTTKPAFYLSAHLGHLLVQNVALKKIGVTNLFQLYHPRKNPYVDQLLYSEHQKWAHPIAKNDAKFLIRALLKGGSLLVLLDQKEDKGESIPFFKRPAMTNVSLLKLAKKLNYPLIPIQVIKEGRLMFRVRFYPKIAPDAHLVNELFETWIKENPEQYWWFHKRWG